MKRKIEVELTEEQYGALASAVANWHADREGAVLQPWERGIERALDNAWNKLKAAWHGKDRS